MTPPFTPEQEAIIGEIVASALSRVLTGANERLASAIAQALTEGAPFSIRPVGTAPGDYRRSAGDNVQTAAGAVSAIAAAAGAGRSLGSVAGEAVTQALAEHLRPEAAQTGLPDGKIAGDEQSDLPRGCC